jgi:hypothetical protein
MRSTRSLSSATVVAVIVLIGGWSNVTCQYLPLRRSTLKCVRDRLVSIVLMSNSLGRLDHVRFELAGRYPSQSRVKTGEHNIGGPAVEREVCPWLDSCRFHRVALEATSCCPPSMS